MDWFAPIDLYCERVGAGLWDEPLNAVSNLAFPIAAVWAWMSALRFNQARPIVAVLCLLAGGIGLGSFLFHVFANHWSEYADVVPIWSFVGLYVLTAIALVGGAPPAKLIRIAVIASVITTLAVLATTGEATSGTDQNPDLLNGSGQYAPALVALLVFSVISTWRKHPIRTWAVAATAVFCLSLGFRTLDLHLCGALPIGTHFMWHILNALMVGVLLQGLVRCSPPRQKLV